MKTEDIKQLFQDFEAVAMQIDDIECWSARALQKLLSYSKWENFEKVIQKAKAACTHAGEHNDDHFPEVRKVIEAVKCAQIQIDDITLTRYACYLVAQNGGRKKQ